MVGRIAGAGRDQLDASTVQRLRRAEAGVGQPGDVGAPRPDAVDPPLPRPQHRAAGHPDHPHVHGPQGGRVAGHLDVGQQGPPALDRGDVGRRAAHLDHHALGHAREAQGARDGRRRTGVERAGGRPPEAVQVGRPAVAAHDHDRGGDAGRVDADGDHLGGALGDGQDRRVERGGDGPQLEAVEPGQLAGGAGRQPGLVRHRGDPALEGGVVRREGLGHADRGRSGLPEPGQDVVHRGLVQAVGHVEELGQRAQEAARGELDALQLGALAGLLELGAPAEAEHADRARRRPPAGR